MKYENGSNYRPTKAKIATYLDSRGKWHALVTFPKALTSWERLEVARTSARAAIRRKLVELGEPIGNENLQITEIWDSVQTYSGKNLDKIKTIDFMES